MTDTQRAALLVIFVYVPLAIGATWLLDRWATWATWEDAKENVAYHARSTVGEQPNVIARNVADLPQATKLTIANGWKTIAECTLGPQVVPTPKPSEELQIRFADPGPYRVTDCKLSDGATWDQVVEAMANALARWNARAF